MSETKQAWEEVGSKFSGLGLKLKYHFETARAAEPSEPAEASEPGTNSEETNAQRERDVREALRKLGDALDDAFEALGAAAKDPAVKQDVKDVGQSLSGALSSTFAEVSEELRKAFRRSGS